MSGWIQSARASSPAPAWLNLVHYQKTLTGYKSEADGPGFFLAPDGRTNPHAELSATIAALSDTTKTYGRIKAPAACVFPARKKYLEQLGHTFPSIACPEFEGWRQGLPVTKISLVFATAYPNNPASMFGHTFLRLNGPGEGKDLLDYVVNFAATTGAAGGVEFALFGVFGGYEGHYSLAPYFIKVNEYNHGEARDLWEYPVSLSPAGIDMLLAHLWELEASTHFDYYFFDENCSWQILRLLEAGDPSWKLSERTPFYVIPGDTVKVLQKMGKLGEPVFRPSLRRSWLARGKPRTPTEKMDGELQRFRLQDRLEGLSDAEKESYHQLLTQRAKDPTPPTPVQVAPASNRPDQGHGLRRIGFMLGDGFRRTELRLAQHDLLDQDTGHERWSQLDVLRLSADENEGRVFLREVTLADVVSLHPWDKLGWRPSWFLKFGAETPRELFCEKCTTAAFHGGLGTSWRFQDERVVLGLFTATAAYGYELTSAAGVRGLVGFAGDRWKVLTTLERLWGISEGDFPWQAELAASWSMNAAWALRVFTIRQLVEKQVRPLESGLSMQHYF